MNDTVVKVDNVSKKFCRNLKRSMYYGAIDVFKSMMGVESRTETLRKGEFWSVDNVSFELKRGATLGIIGINGSGKTTLLRMLNGIFQPDNGRIEINGRIGALIAVGAGFHPLLTGRENVYLNGAILGMSRREIDQKFDEIVEFAEIGEAIDSPVKHYSSGMYVRLGFSVAVNVNPEILLIDEVLSVGDLSFQNKSLRRLAGVRENANAVIFISHNLEHIRNLCDRILVLNDGKMVFLGEPNKAIQIYQELTHTKELTSFKRKEGFRRYMHYSSGDFVFLTGGLLDKENMKTYEISMTDDINIFFEFETKVDIKKVIFSVSIVNSKGIPCIWQMSNDKDKLFYYHLFNGRYKLLVKFNASNLAPGVYMPAISVRSGATGEIFEKVLGYIDPFIIKGEGISHGEIIKPESEWEITKIE